MKFLLKIDLKIYSPIIGISYLEIFIFCFTDLRIRNASEDNLNLLE